ncbi:hypothetical protein BDB00DRAFT_262921 [Zychaea mexicana]|uniref:uncharacterized protein n=1 Tax=Zychaea mexicana TaxID=64656 RepID=UPI0022FEC044|nr:uncharacterized protein BDB00DRAFT_262921 [Zychaea mexicana]KAI9469349.1 hypothetical protein BDB00DRAFT_262921 [Zychaea mexicana]
MTNRGRYGTTSSAIAFPSAGSQRQPTVFSVNGSSVNHANLRRHLRPDELQPQDPPPLVRQGAFMFDETVDPVCRICFGISEDQENGQFIRPCQCRGSMYVPYQYPYYHHSSQSSLPSPPPPAPLQLPPSSPSSLAQQQQQQRGGVEEEDGEQSTSNDKNYNDKGSPSFLLSPLLHHCHHQQHSGDVHDKCLESWLQSVGTTRQCSTCLHDYTLPPTTYTSQQQHHHHHRRRQASSSSSTARKHISSNYTTPPPARFALPALLSSSSSTKKHPHLSSGNLFIALSSARYLAQKSMITLKHR